MVSDEIRCKICERLVYYKFQIKGKDGLESMWLHCSCGCMFNLLEVDKKEVFNEEYKKTYEGLKSIKDRFNYYIRTYIPLIEELTYGRKFLDVGFCLDYNILKMRERGWLATGIDLIKSPYITGDFENHGFGRERFDLIWFGDVLQCFNEPVKAIYKAYNLLQPRGLLFICTPNTDLLLENIVLDWGHWDMQENRCFFSEEGLLNVLARADRDVSGKFNVIMKHSTVSKRFISWNNIHLLAQKDKIEDFKR